MSVFQIFPVTFLAMDIVRDCINYFLLSLLTLGKNMSEESTIKKILRFQVQKTYNVFAFELNSDTLKRTLVDTEPLGVIVFLGSFKRRDKAEKFAGEVIESTGHRKLIVCESGRAIPLRFTYNVTEFKNIVDVLYEDGSQIGAKLGEEEKKRIEDSIRRWSGNNEFEIN